MDLLKEAGVTQAQFVERMKPFYPALTKAAVSVAVRPGESGVQFTTDAKKTACAAFGLVEQGVLRRSNRKKPFRITVWLTKERREFLDWALRNYRHETMTDLIGFLIDSEMTISGYKENAANGAATSDDRTAN